MNKLFFALIVSPTLALANTYTTNFPLNKNPISENGEWINGKAVGLDWSDVQSIPGLAFGTQSGNSGVYDDSTACLSGTWASNQTVQATVVSGNQNTSAIEEVELRLSTTITPHNITGYELDFRNTNPGGYVNIVRWNGPLNKFTILAGGNNNYHGIKNGDVLLGTIVNGTITVYVNGVVVCQATDNTYTGGSPGIGFWLSPGPSSLNATYGFSFFSASDASMPTPTPIPNPPDFDGDGKQDLLWRNTSTGQVGIWLMNGSAPKAIAVIGSPPLSWEIINTGDFDGDGKSDILWQFANTNQYGVWFMNGTQIAGIQNFTLPTSPGNPAYAGQICCVADFDGDGLADLVTFDRLGGVIYFWKNTGSLQFVLQTSYRVAVGSGWLPVGAARLNGPSAPPAVIWRNANTGEIAAWFMSAFVWSSVASFGNPGGDVVLSGFGDFSGDGRADLLLFNTTNNVVGYWQSNGAQQPGSVPLAQVSGTWVPVGAENLTGAGNAEIIWRQSATGALGAWQVSGSIYSIYIGSLLVGPTWQLQPQGFTP
jgi:FG-GAP-like repeat